MNYAVIKNSYILNIIEIEELTESIQSAMMSHYNADDLILVNELDVPNVKIGTFWDGTNFIPQEKPFEMDSWTWDAVSRSWIPPIPEPASEPGHHTSWNEARQEWIQRPLP